MVTSHSKRWVTALIAVPLLFGLIAYGGRIAFAVLITLISIVGIYEYNRMAFGRGVSLENAVTLVSALLILTTASNGEARLLLSTIAFATMAVLILNLLRIRQTGLDMAVAGRALLGILYIPLLMSHFILIRQTPSGVLWIFFILVLAFSGDVAAYYAGRSLGRRKLLPEVSPGKTVEGVVGLVVGSVVGSLLFRQLFFPELAVVHAFTLGLVGSVIGQLGDLVESALKRTAGVKDSGVVVPGHGGILDRLDCLMFIAPFVYYYQEFVIR